MIVRKLAGRDSDRRDLCLCRLCGRALADSEKRDSVRRFPLREAVICAKHFDAPFSRLDSLLNSDSTTLIMSVWYGN